MITNPPPYEGSDGAVCLSVCLSVPFRRLPYLKTKPIRAKVTTINRKSYGLALADISAQNALIYPVTLTLDLSTSKTTPLLEYPKFIPSTNFEHFGFIRF